MSDGHAVKPGQRAVGQESPPPRAGWGTRSASRKASFQKAPRVQGDGKARALVVRGPARQTLQRGPHHRALSRSQAGSCAVSPSRPLDRNPPTKSPLAARPSRARPAGSLFIQHLNPPKGAGMQGLSLFSRNVEDRNLWSPAQACPPLSPKPKAWAPTSPTVQDRDTGQLGGER